MTPASPLFTKTMFNVRKGKAKKKKAKLLTRIKKSERDLTSAMAAVEKLEADLVEKKKGAEKLTVDIEEKKKAAEKLTVDIEEKKKAYVAAGLQVEFNELSDKANSACSVKFARNIIKRKCDNGTLTVSGKDMSKLAARIVACWAMSRGGTIDELHGDSDFAVSDTGDVLYDSDIVNTVDELFDLGIVDIKQDTEPVCYVVVEEFCHFFGNKVEEVNEEVNDNAE
jgi:hypothetical protein